PQLSSLFLHDALPISRSLRVPAVGVLAAPGRAPRDPGGNCRAWAGGRNVGAQHAAPLLTRSQSRSSLPPGFHLLDEGLRQTAPVDRKSTRLNSSHVSI